ncbi:hypothetical protein L218DRAFT_280639 [Marasmius fiardii PR-910]|nr:hypothetical protein L218DRAFT_280639 [Marasmius fiardii PR-910]
MFQFLLPFSVLSLVEMFIRNATLPSSCLKRPGTRISSSSAVHVVHRCGGGRNRTYTVQRVIRHLNIKAEEVKLSLIPSLI